MRMMLMLVNSTNSCEDQNEIMHMKEMISTYFYPRRCVSGFEEPDEHRGMSGWTI